MKFSTITLASLILCSCATATKAIKDSSTIFSQNDRTLELQEPFINGLKGSIFTSSSKMSTKKINTGLNGDILEARRFGTSLASIDLLEKYSNHILNKLINSYGDESHVHATVRIAESPHFSADTYSNGLILLTVKDFLVLENEDQLAALLAHELSHVILNHNVKSFIDQTTRKATEVLEVYMLYNIKAEKGFEAYIKFKTLQWALKNVVMSGWSRIEENEADTLGTDLLVKAGYNGNAMLTMLKHVELTKSADRKRVETFTSMTQTGNSFNFSVDIGSLVKEIIARLEDDLGKGHDDAIERRKHVRAYIKSFYRESTQRPIRAAAYKKNIYASRKHLNSYESAFDAERMLAASAKKKYSIGEILRLARAGVSGATSDSPYNRNVMYNVRLKQSKKDVAVKNLKIVIDSKKAPFYVYQDLAWISYQEGSYDKTLEYIKAAREVFGDVDELLPVQLAATKKMGKNSFMLQSQCLKMLVVNFAIFNECAKADKGML